MKNTTTSINTLKMNGMIPYDTVVEDEGRQIFQCEETEDNIYVLNTETKRATKYNAEGLNGKRISVDEFESKMADMILRVAKQEAEESANTEANEIEVIRQTADRVVREFDTRAKAADQMGAEFESQMFWSDWYRAMVVLDHCETGNITDEDRRFAKSFGANIEIPEQEAPKAKKTTKRPKRISKDIAYSYVERDETGNITTEITLTAKQVDFIKHLPDIYFWENGVESIVWVDCLCDDIQGQFANKPMTVGAMISTLCEKGLGTRSTDRKGPRGGKATSFALTEMGQAVAIDLGL